MPAPCDSRRSRVSRAVGLVLLVAVVLAACGIGDGQAMADRISEAGRAAAAAAPQQGTLVIEVELAQQGPRADEADEGPAAFAGVADSLATGEEEADAPAELTLTFDADLSVNRVRVSHDATPLAFFIGSEIFIRRQSARETEKRIWATLDLLDLTKDERPLVTRELQSDELLQTIGLGINPAYILEFAAGALAGSTELVGATTVGGVSVEHYRTKVALEQMIDRLDLDDDEAEARLRLHDLLRTRQEVVPAEFWIDGDGRLRQVRLELRQQVTRRRKNTVLVTLRFDEFGTRTTVELPSSERTVNYETFARLIRSGFGGI